MGRGRLHVRVQAAVRSPQSAEGSMTLASIPSQAALPLHSSHLLHCRAPPATTQHQHHKHTNLVCRLQGMHHTAHTARRETPTCLRPVSLARRLVDRSMANLCLMGAAQRCEGPPLEFLPADSPPNSHAANQLLPGGTWNSDMCLARPASRQPSSHPASQRSPDDELGRDCR
jgi:hypothetical protein